MVIIDWNDEERKARLAVFWEDTVWWPFSDWPRWAQSLMLRVHKRLRERYNLFVFFVMNGLSPELAQRWIRAKSVNFNGKALVMGDYDQKALTQLQVQMPRQLANGTLVRNPDKRIFDMIFREPRRFGDRNVE